MAAAVPGVEIADDADAGGVGCPDGEIDSFHAVDRAQLGPQPLVEAPVPPFVQQVQIVVGQQGRKCVGVVHHNPSAPFVGGLNHVPRLAVGRPEGTDRLEQPGGMDPPHGAGWVDVTGVNHPSLRQVRQEGADRQGPPAILHYFMGPQQFKGIFMPALDQFSHLLQRRRLHVFSPEKSLRMHNPVIMPTRGAICGAVGRKEHRLQPAATSGPERRSARGRAILRGRVAGVPTRALGRRSRYAGRGCGRSTRQRLNSTWWKCNA